MSKKILWLVVLVIVLLVITSLTGKSDKNVVTSATPIKVGVITALTGDVAYWGSSTLLGAELAKQELKKDGIEVEFIFDDAQLDPKLALNAAQKQVNVDKVDAIFSEFNPAAIAVTSFIKDKNILHVYNAAPVSPLEESSTTYKTFTDFQVGCTKAAQLLKDRGVKKVGVLKNNLEFGQLCTDGVVSIFGENTFIETYNPEATDYRTQLTKLKSKGIEAVFVASFTGDQLTALKNLSDLKMNIWFVGTTDLLTPSIVEQNSSLFSKTIIFGLPFVSRDFLTGLQTALPDKKITNEEAAALAYIHLKQITKSLSICKKEIECAKKEMDASEAESIIGFRGFKNHIADFDVLISEFKDGKFVEVK